VSTVLVTVSGPRGMSDLEWPDDAVLAALLAPVARSCAGVPADELAVVVTGQGLVDAELTARALGITTGSVVNVFPRTPGHPGAPLRRDPAPVAVRPVTAPTPEGAATPSVLRAPRGPEQPQHAPARWCWVGAHGGAGTSSLAGVLGGPEIARTDTWHAGTGGSATEAAVNLAVVVVARTHAAGLLAAQSLAAQTEQAASWDLVLGLVLVADAPGRLPPPCQDLVHLIGGTYTHCWRIPWDQRLRVGTYDPLHLPRVIRGLRRDLEDLTSTPRRRRGSC